VFIAHLRSFLARHRFVHWAVVSLAGVAAAAVVAGQSAALERERAAWGTTRTAWIAVADHAPGDLVSARAMSIPAALVASSTMLDDPNGSVARHLIAAGEIIAVVDVGREHALIPTGSLAVAIAADETSIPVRAGDRVDVFADGAVLATDGVVVAVNPAAVVVAVLAAAAPAVTAAALDRRASIALHG
jgi:hypothetical protein